MPANCPRVLFVTADEEAFFQRLKNGETLSCSSAPQRVLQHLNNLVEAHVLVVQDNTLTWNLSSDTILYHIQRRKILKLGKNKLAFLRWLQEHFETNDRLDAYGLRYRLRRYAVSFSHNTMVASSTIKPAPWLYFFDGRANRQETGIFLLYQDESYRLAVHGFELCEYASDEMPSLLQMPERHDMTKAGHASYVNIGEKVTPPLNLDLSPEQLELVRSAAQSLESVIKVLHEQRTRVEADIAALDAEHHRKRQIAFHAKKRLAKARQQLHKL